MKHYWAAMALLGLGSGVVSGQGAAPKPEQQLDAIFRDWRARQAQVKNVEYVVEGEQFYARGWHRNDAKGAIPDRDHTFRKQVRWVIDFERNGVRRESEEQHFYSGVNGNTFFHGYIVDVCDGTTRMQFRPRDKNQIPGSPSARWAPDYRILDKEASRGLFLLQPDYPPFLAHGHVPRNGRHLDHFALTIPLELEAFRLHGHGIVDGKACVVLRSSKEVDGELCEYWVAPHHAHAIIRLVKYDTGNQKFRYDLRYKQTNDGWLPSDWIVTMYDWHEPTKVSYRESMQVKTVRLNQPIDPAIFRLQPTPGSNVKDETDDELLYYQVQEDGSRTLLRRWSVPEDRGSWLPWLIGVVPLLLMAFVLLIRYRRRQRSILT